MPINFCKQLVTHFPLTDWFNILQTEVVPNTTHVLDRNVSEVAILNPIWPPKMSFTKRPVLEKRILVWKYSITSRLRKELNCSKCRHLESNMATQSFLPNSSCCKTEIWYKGALSLAGDENITNYLQCSDREANMAAQYSFEIYTVKMQVVSQIISVKFTDRSLDFHTKIRFFNTSRLINDILGGHIGFNMVTSETFRSNTYVVFGTTSVCKILSQSVNGKWVRSCLKSWLEWPLGGHIGFTLCCRNGRFCQYSFVTLLYLNIFVVPGSPIIGREPILVRTVLFQWK
jgi:hypothetical protein